MSVLERVDCNDLRTSLFLEGGGKGGVGWGGYGSVKKEDLAIIIVTLKQRIHFWIIPGKRTLVTRKASKESDAYNITTTTFIYIAGILILKI